MNTPVGATAVRMSIVVCADAVGLGDPTLGETLGGAGSESRRRLLGQGLLVKERLPGWSWMRYAYAETTPSLNLAASLAAQIRGGWAEVGRRREVLIASGGFLGIAML